MSSVRHFIVSWLRHFSIVIMSHTLKMHRFWSLYVLFMLFFNLRRFNARNSSVCLWHSLSVLGTPFLFSRLCLAHLGALFLITLCTVYVVSTPETYRLVSGTTMSSVRHFLVSSVRHSFGSAERRGAGAAEDVARGPAELDVDDAVQDEIDGEVDQEQAVGDDRRRLVGKEHLARTPSGRLQHVLPKEVQQSRSSRTFSPGRPSFQSTRRVPPAVRGLLPNRTFSPHPFRDLANSPRYP